MNPFATILIVLGMLSASGAAEPVPRTYYGARLEPVSRVLHGAGQIRVSDLASYSQAVAPYNPAVFMDYCDVRGDGALYAGKLKVKLQAFPKYTAVQLGLSMTCDGMPWEHYEHDVAAGIYDRCLLVLLSNLKQLAVPFYIRIGYECNGSWNGYEPEAYKKAFRRVTRLIRASGIEAATVWCPHPNNLPKAMRYYPGDEWVDWWAVDIFSPSHIVKCRPLIAEARKHAKPVMIGESTPRGVGVLGGKASWDQWFGPYFDLIHTSPGIKAFCYINWSWADFPQWTDWGDARLQQNQEVAALYRKEMALPLYQHATTRKAFVKSMAAAAKSE